MNLWFQLPWRRKLLRDPETRHLVGALRTAVEELTDATATINSAYAEAEILRSDALRNREAVLAVATEVHELQKKVDRLIHTSLTKTPTQTRNRRTKK